MSLLVYLSKNLTGKAKSRLYEQTTYYLYQNYLHMGIWNQLAEYLYIKKRDPNEERTKWMKYMHGMNRISLLMFIVAILIIVFKLVILPLIKK